jgi:hypothetical protein
VQLQGAIHHLLARFVPCEHQNLSQPEKTEGIVRIQVEGSGEPIARVLDVPSFHLDPGKSQVPGGVVGMGVETSGDHLGGLVQSAGSPEGIAELGEDPAVGVLRGSHEESELLDFSVQRIVHGISWRVLGVLKPGSAQDRRRRKQVSTRVFSPGRSGRQPRKGIGKEPGAVEGGFGPGYLF